MLKVRTATAASCSRDEGSDDSCEQMIRCSGKSSWGQLIYQPATVQYDMFSVWN